MPKATSIPGAPPRNVTVEATSPTTINVSWLPPPVERSNGAIVYYKVFFVEVGRSDSEATVTTLNSTSIVLDELKRWTEYKIWVLAGTSVGDGPRSYPYTVRTHEDGEGSKNSMPESHKT
uniref:Fibronectin type-III domain-containing protein n=1 Tax=Anopheles dirus TaxID=7168 RepID=A0A182NNQ4_9DIPT